MDLVYQDAPFAFHLLRHMALIFLYLGLLYGLQIHRQTRFSKFSTWTFGLVALMAIWHGFLFLWTLFLWGPSTLGMAIHHLANLTPVALLLGFWFTPPKRPSLRRLFLGNLLGLFLTLVLTGLLLVLDWLSPTLLLKALYLGLALVGLFLALRLPKTLPRRGRAFARITALGLSMAALLEIFYMNTLSWQGTLLGVAELGLAPLLLAWPYVWSSTRAQSRGLGLFGSIDERGGQQDMLGPYLQQLDVLLQTQSLQQPWNPVPYMTQAVLTWMYQRLRPGSGPRSHLPLSRIVERVLERHEKDLAHIRLQIALHTDPHLYLDPSLGEWLMEMMASYILRHASEESMVEVHIQGSQDPREGSLLYARLRHALLEEPRAQPESWQEHALMLGRLLLLDMGGDWWVEEENGSRTIWLYIPLRGFGRVLASGKSKETKASPASTPS